MTLQEQITQKINDFGGIEKLTTDMQRLRIFSNEKKWFDNMIIYFNGLFSQIVDVEAHAVEYRKASIDTIEYLDEFNSTRNEPTIKFLIDLITFKLSYASGIRKIS
jgi:hypothetical protein